MSITAFDGPVVTFPNASQTGTLTQSNPESGPATFIHGSMYADPRPPYSYKPGQNFGSAVLGWLSIEAQTINQVPSTAVINNIAAAQTAVAATALTLTATTGVTSGVSIVRADTGATVTGLLALDTAMTPVSYGQQGTIQAWDPREGITRNVRVSMNGADQTGTFVIRGYDLYGYPLSETITGSAGTATTAVVVGGVKAFKYIASVTPAGTVNSTGLTVGTGDTIGLPLRADVFGELTPWLGNTAIVASTGFTAAVTTTATASSGDVRGTYALQTASNGVLRLVIRQAPQPQNTTSTVGMLGVAQFSA